MNKHVSIHHPATGKAFCPYCHAYVETDNLICVCCKETIRNKKKYRDLNLVFESMSQSYSGLISYYKSEPFKAPVTIYHKHGLVTYAMPLSILALYVDHRLATNLSSKQKKILKEKNLIDFLDMALKPVGLF